MSLDLSSLNPQQRDAVVTTKGPLLILAGAGTGKTRVISYRIAHMINQGISPESIVALSFTNKAAREMAERVRHLTGATIASKLNLGTFHSFCLKILREFFSEAGLSPRFAIAGSSDQIDLVRKALEELTWQGVYNPEHLHAQISRAKNQLADPQDLVNSTDLKRFGFDGAVVAEVYSLYERQLAVHRLIDFDDCIFKVVKLLRDSSVVREKLIARFRYLLVDEFQDTNQAQLAILEALGAGHLNVCVVGDDDQSIYSWRGAMFETLERFERIFTGTKLVKLEQNYRCSNVILGAANHVIKNNSQRKTKVLWSNSTDQTPIFVSALESEEAEARWVADKCLSLLGEGFRPQDIGILYRANTQSRALEMALREARIPSKTFGGQSFFERKEVKDFMAFLRLITNPEDRMAFWRIINVPTRGIGIKSLERIEELAKTSKLPPFSVISDPQNLEAFGRQKQALEHFHAMIAGLSKTELKSPEDFRGLGTRILNECKLLDDVRENTDPGASRDRKIENLRALPDWLEAAAREVQNETRRLDCSELIDRLTLSDQDLRKEVDKAGNFASLMTIHAAKGLEFPAVFVVGVEEDLLPHKNSVVDNAGIAEERRLFYVALTRAKRKLFLSYALERGRSYGGASGEDIRRKERAPSRFLAEMPAEFILHSSDLSTLEAETARTEVRKTNTLSQLSKIRESLTNGKW